MVKPCPPLMPLSESAARCVRQSFAQSRLWFLHQMDPGRAQHNILVRLVLNGPQLVETRLKHAFNALCIRHPLLRACYRMTPAGPEQWLAAGQSIEVKQRDLSNLPAAGQKSSYRIWRTTTPPRNPAHCCPDACSTPTSRYGSRAMSPPS